MKPRDEFAKEAMGSLLASAGQNSLPPRNLAELAYAYAEAMDAERKRRDKAEYAEARAE